MSGSVNKVILIGNLGADPEIRSLNSGDRVCNLRIATSESWRDKSSGERKEKVEWHRVVIFNEHIVKVVEQYVNKGDKVYIEGSLQTRKWTDQSGVEKYSTEIVLQKFKGELTMLSGKRDGDDSGRRESSEGSGYAEKEYGGGYGGGGGFGGGGETSSFDQRGNPREDFSADPDDEIPF